MTASTKKPQFLNMDDLAKELGIDRAAADALMQRDTFPATVIDGKAYVVDRGLLESWIRHNAKRVDGINAGDLFADLAMTKNKWVNESFSAAQKQRKSGTENGHFFDTTPSKSEKSEALKRATIREIRGFNARGTRGIGQIGGFNARGTRGIGQIGGFNARGTRGIGQIGGFNARGTRGIGQIGPFTRGRSCVKKPLHRG